MLEKVTDSKLCVSRADGGWCWLDFEGNSLVRVYGGETRGRVGSISFTPEQLRLLSEAALLAASFAEENARGKKT